MDEKRKRSPYIDIALGIIFALIAVAVIKGWYQSHPAVPGAGLPSQISETAIGPVEPAAYSLEKVRSVSAQKAPAAAADIKEVYEKFPKSDVGGDMIRAWARIKPEEKARIHEALEKEIEASKEALRQNPEDKKTKNLLYIAETLKALAAKDFNINPGEHSTLMRSTESDKKTPQARRSDGRI